MQPKVDLGFTVPLYGVSIPYRYGMQLTICKDGKDVAYGFNPLQVWYATNAGSVTSFFKVVSIPYRYGMQQTSVIYDTREGELGFNPLQVWYATR